MPTAIVRLETLNEIVQNKKGYIEAHASGAGSIKPGMRFRLFSMSADAHKSASDKIKKTTSAEEAVKMWAEILAGKELILVEVVELPTISGTNIDKVRVKVKFIKQLRKL